MTGHNEAIMRAGSITVSEPGSLTEEPTACSLGSSLSYRPIRQRSFK